MSIKREVIFIVAMLLCVNISVYSQRVNLQIPNTTVQEALKKIENETGYLFVFASEDLDQKAKVSISADKLPQALDQLLKNQNVAYSIQGKNIILQKKAEVAKPTQQQPAPTMATGVIRDAEGEPLPGASVVVKGTTNGVSTDIDGKFSLPNVAKGAVLEVSFVGYQTQEVVFDGTPLDITMSEGQEISEVVVAAYGVTQRKETVTGSIQTIQPTELQIPASNLSTAFAGRLAGVIAYQRSGEPGNNAASFYIRGISTISGTTSPLIILDGMQISAGDLNSVDPEIIESFSILKDATATAMYGTRGANGVMIVKTKSGADLDKAAIGVRLEAYVNQPIRTARFASTEDYMRMYNEAVSNQGTGDRLFSEEDIYNTVNNVNQYIWPNVNWYDEIFKDVSFNQKLNFNIRGGGPRLVYFMNLTANHETGMLKNRSQDWYSYKSNIDLWKYSFQNNIDFNMTKTSKIGLHLTVNLEDRYGPSQSTGSIYGSIINANPTLFPIYYPGTEDEKWVRWGAWSGGNSQGISNPMAVATQGYSEGFASTVVANIDFNQKLDFITPGLSFSAMVAFKNWASSSVTRQQGYNTYYLTGYSQNAEGGYDFNVSPVGEPTRRVLGTSSAISGDRRFYVQAYLNYDRTFGKHNVSAMLHYDQDQYSNNNANNDLITSLPQRKMGFAGRLAYDYARRYMIELNAGYNGSENFAKDHRWGFFPSVSAGWNIGEEAFWQSIKHVVPYLKLRGSYGLVGNDQIGGARYIYLAEVSLQGSEGFTTGYGDRTQTFRGPTYTRYQNNDITWEVGKKMNVGMDFRLFNDLNVNIDFFRENREKIFQQKMSIPNYLGTAASKIYGNLAAVQNQGFDVAVDYNKRIGNDWIIMLKGTFTYATNKVTEYDEAADTRPALMQKGHKLNRIMGYEAEGLYIDEADIANSPTSTLGNIAIAPGDIKFKDQPDAKGEYDGRITADDRVALGYPTVPEIIYGFGPAIQFRKWDFSLYFQGAEHVSLMMSGFQPFGAQYMRNVLAWIADDYWSPENQNINAAFPRLTKYENNHNNAPSTFWLRNARFLKLKNVELGYQFSKLGRVYVSAVNLLTFSPFKHWDPEMGGGAGLSYPTQRSINLGISMNF